MKGEKGLEGLEKGRWKHSTGKEEEKAEETNIYRVPSVRGRWHMVSLMLLFLFCELRKHASEGCVNSSPSVHL